jgi:hypothetical protein
MNFLGWSSAYERQQKGTQGFGGKILKWIFKKWNGMAWTGLVWLRTGTNDGHL